MSPIDGGDDPARRWNRRWEEEGPRWEPAAFVVESARYLPDGGRALDVAGGPGRHALWLAHRGFAVTLVDVSIVALRQARARADREGVQIEILHRDLEHEELPSGPWDVVLIHHFSNRDVLARSIEELGGGGVLLFCQPTVRNLERHDRPDRRYLLEEGELADLAADMPLEVLSLEESWGSEGRHEARLVARRPD